MKNTMLTLILVPLLVTSCNQTATSEAEGQADISNPVSATSTNHDSAPILGTAYVASSAIKESGFWDFVKLNGLDSDANGCINIEIQVPLKNEISKSIRTA